MKTLNELVAMYDEMRKSNNEQDAFQRQQNLRKKLRSADEKDFDSKKQMDLIEKYEAEEEQIKLNEEIMKILINNVKFVMAKELLPKVLEVLNKYEGKRCGDKTKDKIRNEIEESIEGYYAYFDSKSIHIHRKENYYAFQIELNTNYVNGENLKIIDEDNKIVVRAPEDFFMWGCRSYIENSEQFVKDRKEIASQLGKEYKELEDKVSEYNQVYGYVEGIESLHLHSNNLRFYN